MLRISFLGIYSSSVYGCFLDAFDLVDHGKLFTKLCHRGLPSPILCLLINWCSLQEFRVRWGDCYSEPFGVSNGGRQGGVLSPVLFAVYLDGLLEELSESGVGCYWGHMFAGALWYAVDLVLLAPCASALRCMLSICQSYADDHGLLFNATKTQLICFRSCKSYRFLPVITLNTVFHFNDGPDITRALKDFDRKANCILCTFHAADCFVKCFLVKLYCLSLYGCCLWHLGSLSLRSLQIAMNKVMRKVWHLPYRAHVPQCS